MMTPVGMGEIKVTESPNIISAVGLGSCIAVTLYDKFTKIGGLAHVVLPSIKEANDSSNPIRFADVAIGVMITDMKRLGANIQFMSAKIFGGANMFPDIIFSHSPMDVGKRNIEAVRKELKKHNISIVASEVGDHIGRTVIFNISDGSVVVKTARFESRRY
jgi:chemotaxis protein CheD